MNSKNGAVIDADGSTRYYVDDKLHRLDGPAIEYANGDKAYYVDDKLQRLDGPAIEYANGDKVYYVDGKLHRLDGPAIELANGGKEYHIDGKLHRLDGPAIEFTNGGKVYYVDNTLHRLDGPAVVCASGYEEYHIDGKKVTETELIREQKRVVREAAIALLPLQLPPYVVLWILEFSHPYVVGFNQPELMRILYGLRNLHAAIMSSTNSCPFDQFA